MAKVAFDTLALARRLHERAGFTPEHAEGAAQAIAESMADEVATRADIGLLRSDMEVLRAELRTEMAELKADLTRLVLTVATGQVALILAAMFSFVRVGA